MEHAADVFAKELVERLEAARNQHRYDRLALIASPRFLGRLRAGMGKELRALVSDEIDKDLSKADTRAIAEHLPARH